jgi:Domain of unknown function (DUF4349)/Putative zinc-finger
MSTNKHPVEQEELMAYLDGELPTDRATTALAHLEQCPECQALAAELRRLSQQLLIWEVARRDARIPAKMSAALEQRAQEPQTANLSPPAPRDRIIIGRWAWAAGFAILGVIVGLSFNITRLHLPSADLPQSAAVRAPGIAADSDGPVQGGDKQKTLGPPSNSPPSGRSLGRLEQFAKLQNPPPVKFQGPSRTGPMIVRTAGLTFTTKDFDRARAVLDDILKRHHGYVGELNVSTPADSGRSFNATLRVPADQLDATVADLRKLGRVESESQSGQEVTEQYVDLEARLANERNTEQRLTDLLRSRTGKLSDVLAVETEISRVRGEIERMEGERKSLASRVDFATINLNVREDYEAQLQVVPVTTSSRLRNAAVEGYHSMAESIVGIVLFLFSMGPSLLLWGAILFFPARAVWRKIVRNSAS